VKTCAGVSRLTQHTVSDISLYWTGQMSTRLEKVTVGINVLTFKQHVDSVRFSSYV